MKAIESTSLKKGDNIILKFNNKECVARVDFVSIKANLFGTQINENSYYQGTLRKWVNLTPDIKFNAETIFKKIIL
jgi:hypothetical protein